MTTIRTAQTKQGQRMDWQVDAWHAISRAARHEKCFAETDYNGEGALDLNKAKFARLREWLDRKCRESHPAVSATLPSWQHIGDGKWRLGLQGGALNADGSTRPKRALTSVIISEGRLPDSEGSGKR